MSKRDDTDVLHGNSSALESKLDSFIARLSEVSSRLGNDVQRDWLIGKLDDRLSELEDIAFVVELPDQQRCASHSTRKRMKIEDLIDTPIARFESPDLRKAVLDRCSDSPNFLTAVVSECVWERLDNIARGESLRLLPLELLARIFSNIDVEERLQVETISGGKVKTAGQRTQVNFRRAVLETFKSVTTIEDLGPKCSKLKLLQSTGGNWKELQTKFPQLQFDFDGSVLQGFFVLESFCDLECETRMWKVESCTLVHLSGRMESVNSMTLRNFDDDNSDDMSDFLIIPITTDYASCMLIGRSSKTVHLINLSDLSSVRCASMLGEHVCGSAMFFNGFVYAVGDHNGDTSNENEHKRCERYNFTTDSWERIADLNHEGFFFKLVTWNDSLYAVGGEGSGGTVEWYDPSTDTWTVVFTEIALEDILQAAVIIDDTLYYIGDSDFRIWKVDMRTDAEPELCNHDRPLFYGVSGWFVSSYYSLYSKGCFARCVCVSSSDDVENKTWLFWEVFVLDESTSTWRKAESGKVSYKGDREWIRPLLM